MASLLEWKVPPAAQPRPEDYGYDLERALSSVVGLHSLIPADAFTADTLGVERAGNGVLIDDGLVLTIGYLITEAETVWLHLRRRPRGARPCARLRPGDRLRPGAGARAHGPAGAAARLLRAASRSASAWWWAAPAAAPARSPRRIAAKQEFAGYWEYVLDEAIFTYPAHPNWGGTGLISPAGELIGIGSLQVERQREGRNEHLNMVVPIDLLKPILDDLRKFGRVDKPVRPWLGLYSTEIEDKIVIVGIAPKGPAARAELKTGDVILAVAGEHVSTLGRLLSQGLVARRCRRRSAAHALPRGRHLRRGRQFIRPRQVPEERRGYIRASCRTSSSRRHRPRRPSAR